MGFCRFLVLSTLMVLNINISIAFSCDKNVFSAKRETSFFSSLFSSSKGKESANSNVELNIPVTTDAGAGCLLVESGLSLNVKIAEDNSAYEIDVQPMQAEYDNVSEFQQKNLVFFADHESLGRAQIAVVSYSCSGQNVLAVESYYGSIIDILNTQKSSNDDNNGMSVSTIIATGAAATALAKRRALLNTRSGSDKNSDAMDIFVNIARSSVLRDGYVKPIVPSFMMADKMSGRHTSLSHEVFSNQEMVVNLCNPNVAAVFKDYSVDNLNESIIGGNPNIKLKKKKSGFVIKKEIEY
ncbi:MAG: hypothetical protein AABY53_04895 [Bdellovibrionota bacterium]